VLALRPERLTVKRHRCEGKEQGVIQRKKISRGSRDTLEECLQNPPEEALDISARRYSRGEHDQGVEEDGVRT